MFRKRYYYVFKVQYLGFRYHGWQKQPDVLTVERMMERTLSYVLEHKNFKLLAAGRTDAKVSVDETYVQLFLDNHPLPEGDFITVFNNNLPQDIRVLEMREVDIHFNLINAPKSKEYRYHFAYGVKNHPFAAPFMVTVPKQLDIKLMQAGASLFEGTHDFRNYAYKPNPETKTVGHIFLAEIIPNTTYTASFFPKESYCLRVKGKGFKRHQIRLMMGTLFDLGLGKIDLSFIKKTLQPETTVKLEHIAQASGLLLHSMDIEF